MDVHDKLDEAAALLEGARSMPMSASCIVNRAGMLAVLDEIRELLPVELERAEAIISDREAVIAEGREQVAQLLEDAQAEQDRLVAGNEITAMAKVKAEEIRAAAREEARAIRREVDDYVDSKLANFEVVLNKTIAAVQRGRERMVRRGDLEDLAEQASS